MIELRWLERMLDEPGYGHGSNVEKVLQYRLWETIFDDTTGRCGWSDWQDVPTVKE